MEYHITWEGTVEECGRKTGRCFYGSANSVHFPTQELAQAAWEEINKAYEVKSLKKPKPKVDDSRPMWDGRSDSISSEMTAGTSENPDEVSIQNIHQLIDIDNAPVGFLVKDEHGGFLSDFYSISFSTLGEDYRISIPGSTQDMEEARDVIVEKMKNTSISDILNEGRLDRIGDDFIKDYHKVARAVAEIQIFGEALENLHTTDYTPPTVDERLVEMGVRGESIDQMYVDSVITDSTLNNDDEYDAIVREQLIEEYRLSFMPGLNDWNDDFTLTFQGENMGSTTDIDLTEVQTVRDFRVQSIEALENFDPEPYVNTTIRAGIWNDHEEFGTSITNGKNRAYRDRDYFLGVAKRMREDLEKL